METLDALAEPTRRTIVEILAGHGQMTATDIYHEFSTSPSAVSQHLKILRDADLVKVEKDAQKRLYQLNPEALRGVEGWIRKLRAMWTSRGNKRP